MEGIRGDRESNSHVIILDSVSDEFADYVKARLAEFCYGAVQAAEDRSFYSLEKTIAEFFKRFDTKAHSMQIGMAGELITHALMPLTNDDLTSAAVFFNKEERNIKKGFDLTFHQESSDLLWYGEVKSGEVAKTQSANEKAIKLLSDAAKDIEEKLGKDARRSRWEAAAIDAGLTLESKQALNAKSLLRSHSEIATGNSKLTARRVFLAAAVMHEIAHCEVDLQHLANKLSNFDYGSNVSEARVLVIQQSEIESLIARLRDEIADE